MNNGLMYWQRNNYLFHYREIDLKGNLTASTTHLKIPFWGVRFIAVSDNYGSFKDSGGKWNKCLLDLCYLCKVLIELRP